MAGRTDWGCVIPQDHAYLYLGSISEARRNNELDDWRMSHKQNILCKETIEDAIRKGFDGMHLDKNSARSVIEEYGFKRVGWVLAATLQQKKEDGRFSPQNKEWAVSTFIPRSDRNHDFTVQSHPAVLDGFVNQFRKEQDQLQMFDRTHCTTMTGEELEGKVLVMSPYPSTLDAIDRACEKTNSKSRSDFLERAAQFYCGYIAEQDACAYRPANGAGTGDRLCRRRSTQA